MSRERYRLSFTTGGLFLQEAPGFAALFLTLRDWPTTRAQIRAVNQLQVRTAAAATRISKELIGRLELLDTEELDCIVDGSARERSYVLWAAACRRYAFIRDFAIEVMLEHYLSLRYQLTLKDYDSFYNSKAIGHEELDAIAASTHNKLRQNLFRMLRDADLLSDQYIIQPALLTPRVAQLLARQGREALRVFPATNSEVTRWLQ
jgi:hypothetical protein